MAGRINFLSVTGLTTREFHAATQTNVAAIQWAKLHGLLAANQVCATCNRTMVWSQAGPGKSDEFRWRCGRPCNKTLSIRSGSFFTIWRKTLKVTLAAIRQVAMAPLSRGIPFPVHGAVMEELESDVDVPNITVLHALYQYMPHRRSLRIPFPKCKKANPNFPTITGLVIYTYILYIIHIYYIYVIYIPIYY